MRNKDDSTLFVGQGAQFNQEKNTDREVRAIE